jgi:hypothetical protein
MQKPRKTQIETPYVPQGRDLFQTPNYAVDLLVPFLDQFRFHRIWDCACGEGRIVDRLVQSQLSAYGTDIRDGGQGNCIHNFLFTIPTSKPLVIITNPPYSLTRKFYRKCIQLGKPFALLINADYCKWKIDAVRFDGCEKIVPDVRIDYITPTGLSGATGNTSYFHTMWLTRGLNIGRTETFVTLTKKDKENI